MQPSATYVLQLVGALKPYVGLEIAQNLVASFLYAIASLCIFLLSSVLRKRIFALPLKVVACVTVVSIRRKFSKSSLDISGFYHALYDSASIEERNNQSPLVLVEGRTSTISSSQVGEVIYLYGRLNSSKCVAFVLRRVKKKNGAFVVNAHYENKAVKRIEGRFSVPNHVLFGVWLDPSSPEETSGTTILKFRSQGHQQQYFFDGTWQGYVNDSKTGEAKNYFGKWHLFRIASDIKTYTAWRKALKAAEDKSGTAQPLLEGRLTK